MTNTMRNLSLSLTVSDAARHYCALSLSFIQEESVD